MGFNPLDLFGGGVLSPQSQDYERVLRDQMAGRGPSLASAMLAAQTSNTMRRMAGMAGTRQGVNSALAMRNAMTSGEDLQQQNAQTAATERAREQMGAEQAFGELSNKREAAQGAAMGGLTSSIGSLALMSDERAKTAVKPASSAADEMLQAFEPHTYNYKDGVGEPGARQLGVIAQDVERVAPGMVSTGSQGMKEIDVPKMVGSHAALLGRLHDRLSAIEARFTRAGR